MLNNKEFDLWADGYDKATGRSDEEGSYPFSGYKKVLSSIYQIVIKTPEAEVLDIGFGTGVLTSKLYERGCNIYGMDFSSRMIETAEKKMPGAHLYQGDFTQGLVEPLTKSHYDYIIATYSLHHLRDDEKVSFISKLREHLKENGRIIIGDVAFETRKEEEECRSRFLEKWDDDEIYFVYDELKLSFPSLSFKRISFCAGILMLGK